MSTKPKEALKTIFFWLFVVISLIVLVNLSRGAVDLHKASDRVENAEREVAELNSKKQELEDDLKWKQSEAFVEQEIRNELYLARPDDVVVMVDEDLYESVEELEQVQREGELIPNWKLWLDLFW